MSHFQLNDIRNFFQGHEMSNRIALDVTKSSIYLPLIYNQNCQQPKILHF